MAAIHVTIPEDLYALVKARVGDSQDALDRAVADALRQSLAKPTTSEPSLDEQRARIRAALGDLAAPANWLDDQLEALGGPLTPEEEEEYYRTMPVLDPPLSQTLIQMREEERY